MCRKNGESMDDLLLQCQMAFSLWLLLLMETVLCNTLLCQKFKFFVGKKRSVVLRRCAMRESFWVIWVARNRWIF